ncbi:MAG: PQQ-dependent sugar dehydrogenase [Acidobacteriota bacterium]
MLRSTLVVLLALLVLPLSAATVPTGFTDVSLFDLGAPTALAFTPDGRLLVTTQGGQLRVYKEGALLATPALSLGAGVLCSNSERGLLGVAVDPDFASNRFVYLYYTHVAGGGCMNRVSRFTFNTGTGSDTVDAASELVLVDNMPSPAGNHNAGDVHFGPDGYLYISIGDGGCDWAGDSGCGGTNDATRDQHVLTGKILRITKTGDIPPENPFQGAGTARCNVTGQTTAGNKCQETFAWGFRNPFRFAMNPNRDDTYFFINDVGQSAWEEIDFGTAGGDFGWNCREGAHTNSATGKCSPTPPDLVEPFFEYQHGGFVPGTADNDCGSITGGAFVPDGVWPGYDGTFLFGDFNCGKIFRITQGAGGVWTGTRFAVGAGGVTSMVFGPYGVSQAFYYLTYAGGGQVHRVSYGPFDFNTLTPCRLVDTRTVGPALAANSTRTFTATGVCGVPATATVIAVNVTVIGASSSGDLQLWPTGTTAPGTSVLSFQAGQTRANNAFVELGASGGFSALAAMPSGSAHLVVDVVGWYE